MAPPGRVVPWASWREWQAVRAGLLSDSPAGRREAIRQVEAWRCRGRVPLGVDATACLVEATMRDSLSSEDPALATPEALLRLQYAMAIVRLVNGVTDSGQKGRLARSVASLADAVGLPRVLVDVRHEAAHNELPSLPLLRLAAGAGLAWLRAGYWARQAECVEQNSSRVAELLTAIMTQHFPPRGDKEPSAPGGRGGTNGGAAVKAASSGAEGVPPGGTGAQDAGVQGGGVEGPRQRKAALVELRDLVPASAVHLIVEALLDHGAWDASLECETSCDNQRLGKAWRLALEALSAAWPALQHVLLVGTVSRLVDAAESRMALGRCAFGRGAAAPGAATPGPAGGHEISGATIAPSAQGSSASASQPSKQASLQDCRRWSVFVTRVAPRVAQQQKTPRSAKRKGAGDIDMQTVLVGWQPDVVLARDLLAAALKTWEEFLLLSPRPQNSSKASDCHWVIESALRTAAWHLIEWLGAAPGGGLSPASNSILLDLWKLPNVCCPPRGRPDDSKAMRSSWPVPSGRPEDDPSLEVAAERQVALLNGALAPVALPPRVANWDRWNIAMAWRPCAIGTLPCVRSPNGRLPHLELPGAMVSDSQLRKVGTGVETSPAGATAKADRGPGHAAAPPSGSPSSSGLEAGGSDAEVREPGTEDDVSEAWAGGIPHPKWSSLQSALHGVPIGLL